MKKIFNISLAAVAILGLALACNKDVTTTPENNPDVTPAEEIVTIKATLSDALTRVDFTPTISQGKTTAMALAWADGDKVRVFNHDNREQYDDFTLAAEAVGEKVGVFTGTPTHLAGATSYDVEVINVIGNEEVTDGIINNSYDFYINQTQPKDGDPGDLKYFAKVKDINDYSDIQFDEVSGVLAISAKLPEGVAATIKSVDFIAGETLFPGDKELTITLAQMEDVGEDNILNLFATLDTEGVPSGGQPVELIVRFNAPGTGHTVYTRYVVLEWPTINPNSLNTININATESDLHAGLTSCDGTTADKAYLIGDQYQMDAMHQLMVRGEKKYFKLIDNIDMTGIVWYPLNNGYPESGGTKYTGNVYDKALDFNGNNKEIKNIETKSSGLTPSDEYASIFGVLMGNVYDLTIDHATIHPQGKSGILAGYVGTGSYGPNHCEVTNVTIKNSTLTGGESYCGALAGQSAKNGNVFSNIVITDCTVSTTSYAAGLVAYFANSATVSDISVQGTDISSTGSSNATAPVPQDGIAGGIAAVVKAAVDFDRCAYENATITGPKNTNASPSTNSRYIGGLAGYVYNYATTFDDCEVNSVELALDAAGSNNNGRYMGGAFGYIGSSVVVGETAGCTVTDLSGNSNIRNYVAGFIGYNDGGTIKNSSAAGSITSRGGLGGFVAVTKGGTYDDDTADVTISGVGNLGGFAGITETTAPVMTNCSASGDVTASGSYAGGFVAYSAVGKYESCSASGEVSSSGTYSGGFSGCILDGEILKCSAYGSVTSTANFAGGFSGGAGDPGTGIGGTVSIDKSMASGNAQGSSTVSGFVAYAIDGVLTISDSFATGNMLGSARRRGGLIAWVENADVTVTNCYVSGSIVGYFEIGGLIGLLSTEKLNMSNSAAWNSSITASTIGPANWSSAAVVGVTYLTSTLTDNYRSPNMQLTAYWGNAGSYAVPLTNAFQHPNVSASAPLTDPNGNAVTSSTMRPYQGKCEVGKTLSQLASTTLGWSSEVWDFNGNLPTLR